MDILAKLRIKAVLLLFFLVGIVVLFLNGVNNYTQNPKVKDLDYYNDNENNGNDGNSTLIPEYENSGNSTKPNATEIYNEYVLHNYTNITNETNKYMIQNSKRKKVKKEYKPVQIELDEN